MLNDLTPLTRVPASAPGGHATGPILCGCCVPGGTAESEAGRGFSGPLGNTAKSSPPPPPDSDKKRKAARATRYQAQSQARTILRRKALADGLPFEKKHPGDVFRTIDCRYVNHGDVGVHMDTAHGAAHYGGLVTCGSPWACSVCAAKIQERRRAEIEEAMAWAKAEGLMPVLVTLTFPHRSWQRLDDLLRMQADAFKRLRRGNPWGKLKDRIGFQGLIRSLEVTHGKNGWHPHTHELWFVSRSAGDFRGRLVELWERACIAAGLLDGTDGEHVAAFRRHSVDVKHEISTGDYLAKQDDSRAWGLSHEVAKATSKAGRAKGVHPHHFLVRQADGDAERFVEYVTAMKGKRQLFWSHGLKKRVGVGEISDEDLADEEREPAELLTMLTDEDWKIVRGNDARAELLDAAETGGVAAITALLESLRPDPAPEPEPGPVPPVPPIPVEPLPVVDALEDLPPLPEPPPWWGDEPPPPPDELPGWFTDSELLFVSG